MHALVRDPELPREFGLGDALSASGADGGIAVVDAPGRIVRDRCVVDVRYIWYALVEEPDAPPQLIHVTQVLRVRCLSSLSRGNAEGLFCPEYRCVIA